VVRKLTLASLTVAFLLLGSTPSIASPAPLRVQVMLAYARAAAYWTTCPQQPSPPGVVCTSTYLYAYKSKAIIVGSDAPSTDRFAWLQQGTFTYDEAGNFIVISGLFAEDMAPSFSIDTARLSTASLRSTMTVYDCFDVCVPTGSTMSVATDWTGQGSFLHGQLRYHQHDPCVNIFNLDLYGMREASFSGTVNGLSPGTPVPDQISPDLSLGRSGAFEVYRDCTFT
jgi:hypothetical protein